LQLLKFSQLAAIPNEKRRSIFLCDCAKKKNISLVLQLLKFSQLAAIPNEKRRKPTLTTPVSAFSRLGYINVRLI
jgi:hypothetical protein